MRKTFLVIALSVTIANAWSISFTESKESEKETKGTFTMCVSPDTSVTIHNITDALGMSSIKNVDIETEQDKKNFNCYHISHIKKNEGEYSFFIRTVKKLYTDLQTEK